MNYALQLILVSVILFVTGTTQRQKRIIGGDISRDDDHKWKVSIKGDISVVRKAAVYAASIIKSEKGIYWLVTAAHCFFPSNGVTFIDMSNAALWHVALTKFESVYEKHGLKDKAMEKLKSILKNKLITNDFHIKKIIVHPEYKPVKKSNNNTPNPLDNDIALIKLSDPLPDNHPSLIYALDLPDSSVWPEAEKSCIVAGWDCKKTSSNDNYNSKAVNVKILSNGECEKLTSKSFLMNPKIELCVAQSKKENGFCLEDIGSGLVCDRNGKTTLAGVLSRGYSDLPITFPPVFTRVSSYVNWIKDNIKNN